MNPILRLSTPVITLSFIACSTIPKDAPAEFSRAEKEISSAKKENVDDILPKTVRSAEKKLAQASDDWRKADAPKAKEAATGKAWAAAKIAEDARNANAKIRGWDENIESFVEDTAGKAAASTAATEAPVGARLDELSFNKPVAYFNTASSRLSTEGKKSVDDLAKIMLKEPKMIVTVIGRADPMGPAAINEHLCLARAEVVAKELRARGIDPTRVKIQTAYMGRHRGGRGAMMGPGHMQLQRRVDVEIKTEVAH